jgi:uncharacterized protein YjiK
MKLIAFVTIKPSRFLHLFSYSLSNVEKHIDTNHYHSRPLFLNDVSSLSYFCISENCFCVFVCHVSDVFRRYRPE